MIDDGETDWKCIVINVDDILAPRLNDIDDVEAELSRIGLPAARRDMA